MTDRQELNQSHTLSSLMHHMMERCSQIPTIPIRPGSGAEAPELEAMLLFKLSTYLTPGNTPGEKLFPVILSQENPLPNTDPLCHQSHPYETSLYPSPGIGADMHLSSSSYRKTL